MSGERSEREIRTRPRGIAMPELIACDNCGLTYYQTEAPHVCAEWTGGAKESQIMNTSIDKWCECQHALYNHGEDDFSPQKCNIIGCECENFAPAAEHEPVARGGEEEWRIIRRDGRTVLVNPADDTIAFACGYDESQRQQRAEQIVTEHNQHRSLLTERERLRKALSMLVCNSCHNRIGWNETPTKYGDWTKCTSCRNARAALNDQKGE